MALLSFLIISWFSFGNIKLTFNNFKIKKTYSNLDFIKSLVIIFYGLFLIYDKGLRVSGAFVDFRGDRSILEDYIAIIFLVFFISSRASKFLIVAFAIISISYLMAGERMRMFIYGGTIFVYLYRNKLFLLKLGLPIAYIFAEIISVFRSSTSFGVRDSGYFVSHFGSVTVSSLYLDEFTSVLPFTEKIQYYFGIIIGNFIPSSTIPKGFDIRGDLLGKFEIPGGGWFTSFILSTSNWYIYILTIIMICLLLRHMMNKKSLVTNYMIFFIIITSPRWFMYSPYLIFRFSIYAVLLLTPILLINKGRYLKTSHFSSSS
ncbi:hypothetical protein [uncultured Polaribacter sp.]|uniref:hypothetical protein n=1 Tax=uncultured Polaribacter sp. TaxID=174711 RepID=UPI00260D65E0|nr:hypothetical protein [uncultured Polaribacter sp.]